MDENSSLMGCHRFSLSEILTMLTDVLLLLHAGAGTVVAAYVHGTIWGHWWKQRITWRNWWKGVVPHQLLHFTGPGVPVWANFSVIRRNWVKGNGAIVEVQCGWRGHVGSGGMVELWGAVVEDGLLFNDSAHQLRRADWWRWHYCETVSTDLDLQLLRTETF